ncbi:MAG: hypothetical protein AAF741_05815 [Bacteroidota bacterium]
MDNISLLIFGLLGWGLSLYFGFFRFRQYQWTRRKVEGDLFARLNQNGRSLYWKLRSLAPIKEKNAKLKNRYAAVLEKYLDHWAEKRLLLQSGTISNNMGEFWLRIWLDELRQLLSTDREMETQLLEISTVSYRRIPALKPIIEAASRPTIEEEGFQRLYQQLIK